MEHPYLNPVVNDQSKGRNSGISSGNNMSVGNSSQSEEMNESFQQHQIDAIKASAAAAKQTGHFIPMTETTASVAQQQMVG
jgi:hypothetical protein